MMSWAESTTWPWLFGRDPSGVAFFFLLHVLGGASTVEKPGGVGLPAAAHWTLAKSAPRSCFCAPGARHLSCFWLPICA